MKQWWDIARASGLVAWLLLAASLVLGVVLSSKLLRRPRPVLMLDLHRYLGGLAVTFVGVHLAALVADSFIHFGSAELLVPLASTWRPGAVAWGIVATYLLLAVEATSLLMRRLPRRGWYAVHLCSYALFALATVHGLLAGTDGTNPVVRWGGAVIVGLTVFLLVLRVPAGTESQLSDASSESSSSGNASSTRTGSPVTG